MHICADCGDSTWDEYYMLRKYLWHKYAHDVNEEQLCIGCFEERLGRKLKGNDFMGAPINSLEKFNKSDRLTNRLTAL